MSRALAVAGAGAIAIAACSLDVDLAGTRCDATHACGGGLVCIGGACQRPGGGAAGGAAAGGATAGGATAGGATAGGGAAGGASAGGVANVQPTVDDGGIYRYELGVPLLEAVAGDFDADGLTDLAVITQSHDVWVLLFRSGHALVRVDLGAGNALKLARLKPSTMSGRDKVAFLRGTDSAVRIYELVGTTHGSQAGVLPAPMGATATALASTDFDRNGGDDLAIAYSPPQVAVTLMNSAGFPVTGQTVIAPFDGGVGLLVAEPGLTDLFALTQSAVFAFAPTLEPDGGLERDAGAWARPLASRRFVTASRGHVDGTSPTDLVGVQGDGGVHETWALNGVAWLLSNGSAPYTVPGALSVTAWADAPFNYFVFATDGGVLAAARVQGVDAGQLTTVLGPPDVYFTGLAQGVVAADISGDGDEELFVIHATGTRSLTVIDR